jgi:hypothetical protein
LYSLTYTAAGGVPTPVDVARMESDGNGYFAETGLLQFGPVNEAIVLSPGELPSAIIDDRGEAFWTFVLNDPSIEVAVTLIDPETGAVQDFDVGPGGGPLFGGDVAFEPLTIP